MKKLHKSSTNKMLDGVCAGIGEYLGVDPTLIRVIWAFFAMSGAGIFAYILCCAIMPSAPEYP